MTSTEELQVVELIPFNNFKEKIAITKKYYHTSKIEIIDNKYVYVIPRREEHEWEYYQQKNI